MSYEQDAPTPMLLAVSIHPSRFHDLLEPETLKTEPIVPVALYIDSYGNRCSRIVAPAGRIRLWSRALLSDDGEWDAIVPDVPQTPVDALPDETLVFLLGSRYCETDRLATEAWARFGPVPGGTARVRAICDYVNRHIAFGYQHADPMMSAAQVAARRAGVCRDYTHLAVALCRCMNIPARYCTGYISDIGLPPPYAPMDFAAWFEAYLDGRWHTFDPRNNAPRKGRILMARGRDATDVPITNSFGPMRLANFSVLAEEVRQ